MRKSAVPFRDILAGFVANRYGGYEQDFRRATGRDSARKADLPDEVRNKHRLGISGRAEENGARPRTKSVTKTFLASFDAPWKMVPAPGRSP